MIDIKKKISVIEGLLDDKDPCKIRYAALECRLSIEEVCYDRLRLAHKYIPLDKVKDWQPPKLLKFLFRELEPSILGGSKLSISRTPQNGVQELSREDYEAIDWVEVGEQPLLNIKRISKLYYKISKHLHANMPTGENSKDVGDCQEVTKHVQQVVAELKNLSKGKLDFFHPTELVTFQCLCGEEICRTELSLQNAEFVSCLGLKCRITYIPKLAEQGYEFFRRVFQIDCPHCSEMIRQEFADVEQLSIGSKHATECPNCKGGVLLSPGFTVSKHVA